MHALHACPSSQLKAATLCVLLCVDIKDGMIEYSMDITEHMSSRTLQENMFV